MGLLRHRRRRSPNLQVETPISCTHDSQGAHCSSPSTGSSFTSGLRLRPRRLSRRIAFYKMVAIVRGTNIVRKELGLPEAPCLASEPEVRVG